MYASAVMTRARADRQVKISVGVLTGKGELGAVKIPPPPPPPLPRTNRTSLVPPLIH